MLSDKTFEQRIRLRVIVFRNFLVRLIKRVVRPFYLYLLRKSPFLEARSSLEQLIKEHVLLRSELVAVKNRLLKLESLDDAMSDLSNRIVLVCEKKSASNCSIMPDMLMDELEKLGYEVKRVHYPTKIKE